ncbi:putative DOMON domain, cytochrome b561/ferric reductase transmembrane, DM13 [Rosa chinensis]|uniref:Putative DOMON domain, cytochrome b561/ferric reductase transmembrane, DM13 n=1 Tax=Rosa chinensis TaxID=74649 RepID=A0A2P6PY97_ROSCH|nr:cytochrome b561, DM13 and DOMON domain-containing protein At5g54830 [Rosa chinensis]PRQ26905.1 putative DOMON domain, cytochrome b561/ferric reductase transmembrane, DM13 [Rosa chinensis]
MPRKPTATIFLVLLLLLLAFCYADPGSNCPKTSPLVNLESQFKMLQHQLRGSVKILDDCSFQVSNFDMLSGSDVHWWGAVAPDFNNLTAGFVISDQKLNETYKSASFTVRLRDNVTWDQIQVLAVWDLPTSSDFGHIVLRDVVNRSSGSSDLAPSPSPASDSGNGTGQVHTEPTMLVNCKSLSDDFRVRWTLRPEENVIDIGLEAATGSTNYMAFGWARPNITHQFMLGADVAVAGFKEDGMPFVDDFYITKYSECTVYKDGSVKGVCPDTRYEGTAPNGLVNNTKLVYGHRRDAVSFIRYQRPLESADKKYDLAVKHTEKRTVIWAVGPIRPPDTLQPYYLPQNHGGPQDVVYGHLELNVSEHVDDCYGPIEADDKEDQHLIIADAKAPLVVTSGQAVHYPDPPNPSKVLYINKKEAPVLRVERGVPVTFSIQAGHDVALYITSDPLGGNATLRNASETVYAGGSEAQGVQASPKELIWAPDRNTPDLVYYQSLYDQKMGWKVQVVDGGLSDMYNNSVILDDQQVTLFWTLAPDSISIAVRGEKKSGFVAIGFGRGMVNSYAYVGWIDNIGKGRVNTYWIDGKDASSVHPTHENLTYVRCRSENGIITFEFTRPLKPSCGKSDKPECKNIIDPTTPLKIIWAMGATWTDDHLGDQNMHFATSSRPIRVLLMRGSAEAEQDLQPVLAVHGFMMFLAWAILLPGGILAARYLKHVKGDGWYRIHVYLQYSGLVIVLLALLFAVAELRGFFFGSLHVKFGTTAIFLVCMQPVNAYLRPKRPNNGEQVSSKRVLWEYLHVIGGRSAIVVGFGALFTGLKHLGDRYGGENVDGLNLALIVWFLICVLIVIYLEYYERQRRRNRSIGRSNWVLGNLEEDDSVDLLSPNGIHSEKESHTSGRMEVQLEPLNR